MSKASSNLSRSFSKTNLKFADNPLRYIRVRIAFHATKKIYLANSCIVPTAREKQ